MIFNTLVCLLSEHSAYSNQRLLVQLFGLVILLEAFTTALIRHRDVPLQPAYTSIINMLIPLRFSQISMSYQYKLVRAHYTICAFLSY